MSETEQLTDLDVLVGTWWTLPDVSEALGVDVLRVRQLLRDGQLLALRGGDRNVLRVPADFIQDARVLKGLPGTLTVLADCGYAPEETLRWLFSADETLPGSPVQALRENRGTEVRRRAQALAF